MQKTQLSKNFEEITGQSFELFYHKYKPKLIWYLTRFTRDQEKAEDFADDAFTQALLKIGNYNNERSQVHTWIYKIGENLVKKDFKDQKRMMIFSLDKEYSDNLNLKNIVPHSNIEDKNEADYDALIIKKAEIIKEAIMSLPEKYKRVMYMRELENRPYLEIAELCTKDYHIDMKNDKKEMPSPTDFLDIFIENNGKVDCYINFTYNNTNQIQMEVKPGEQFKFDKNIIDNINKVEVISNDEISGIYRTTTNLSTIKSQISKGRQLISAIVKKQFKYFEENGVD